MRTLTITASNPSSQLVVFINFTLLMFVKYTSVIIISKIVLHFFLFLSGVTYLVIFIIFLNHAFFFSVFFESSFNWLDIIVKKCFPKGLMHTYTPCILSCERMSTCNCLYTTYESWLVEYPLVTVYFLRYLKTLLCCSPELNVTGVMSDLGLDFYIL